MARTRSRPLTTNERPTSQFSADQLPADQLSRDGLSRLHDSMAAHVAAGRLPGLVTLWPVATTCTSSLGLEVPATGSADQPLPCGIGWDGGTGTTWRSSPHSGVTGILFTQRAVTSPVPPPVVEDFWAGVNAATATP